MLLLLALPVWAADAPTAVLVSSFFAGDPASAPLAASLESDVAERLGTSDRVRILRVEDAGWFDAQDPRLYLKACPPSTLVGCAQVVGRHARAELAVTGSLRKSAVGALLQLQVVDVNSARVVHEKGLEVAPGAEGYLTDAVVAEVLAVVAGKAQPAVVEPDDEEVAERDPTSVDTEVGRELRELATSESVVPEGGVELKEKDLSKADLAPLEEGAVGAWATLGYDNADWEDYQRSGLGLDEWLERAQGHAGQVLIRVFAGGGLAPVRGTYVHEHYYASATEITDDYSGQATGSGGAPLFGAGVRVGLSPILDVGVAGGWSPGSLAASFATEGAVVGEPEGTSVLAGVYWVRPEAELVLWPTRTIHPTAGVGFTFYRGPTANSWVVQQAYADPVPAAWLGYVTATPGVSVRLGDPVDLFVQVPVGVQVFGKNQHEVREGTESVLTPELPDTSTTLTVNGVVGVTFRVGGRKPPEIPEVLLVESRLN